MNWNSPRADEVLAAAFGLKLDSIFAVASRYSKLAPVVDAACLIEPAILARTGSTPAAIVAFDVSTAMSLVPCPSRTSRGRSGAGNQRPYAAETAAIIVNDRLRAPPLRLGFVIAGDLVDLFRGHLAGDVAHLLADVVAAGAGRERLQLRLDVDSRLTAKPGTTGLVVDVAMAGAARCDVAHRRPRRDDRRCRHRRIELVRWHARQIG